MKAEDLKGKSEDELNKMLLDLRQAQLNLRFQKNSGQLATTSDIRKTRRDIARVKTLLSAKTENGATASAKKPAAQKTASK